MAAQLYEGWLSWSLSLKGKHVLSDISSTVISSDLYHFPKQGESEKIVWESNKRRGGIFLKGEGKVKIINTNQLFIKKNNKKSRIEVSYLQSHQILSVHYLISYDPFHKHITLVHKQVIFLLCAEFHPVVIVQWVSKCREAGVEVGHR